MRFLLAFKILLFTVLVPGSVILYLPYRWLSQSGADLQSAGPGLIIPSAMAILIGAAIYLRCAWDFAVEGLGTPAPIDPPKHLVMTGLYRRTRNPMYQGMVLLLFAEGLLFTDPGLFVYAGIIAVIFHLFVVFYEEPALNNRFGEEYGQYCRQVPRWGLALRPYCQPFL